MSVLAIGGILPLLLILACPAMMILMMLGMRGHGHGGHGHGGHSHAPPEPKTLEQAPESDAPRR